MKSKKAFVIGETTIKVVVALIIIVFVFIPIGVAVYKLYYDKSDLEKAKIHMESIERIVVQLNKQGVGSEDYVLLSPSDWALIGWPSDVILTEPVPGSLRPYPTTGGYAETDIPNKCKKNGWSKCLCLCLFKQGDILEGCNVKSSCIDVGNYDKIITDKDKNAKQSTRILINDLINQGKSINIKIENNELKISVK